MSTSLAPCRVFVAVAVLSMMLLAAPARADTVTQWNQIATSALVADGQGSSAVASREYQRFAFGATR
jgi:hypothetical protein